MQDIEHGNGQLQMEQMFLRVQRKLFGDAYRRTMAHYAVVRPIGQGAMGMVYEAFDQRLSREVALKLVLPERVQSERGKSRLVREARAMAKISHPNVVAVYDVGESGGVVYIAMEFVRGVTLRRWLAGAPRSLGEIIDVFVQAGAGLAAAHHADIIHRDFKPDNVLVGADGRARVLDFGLAFPRVGELAAADELAPAAALAELAAGFNATLDGGNPEAPPLPGANPGTNPSASNMLAGTIAYMSPEQLMARPLDARSDQFSFCVSLYEAVYGQRPFAGRSFNEFVDHVQRGELAPVAAPPRLPSWIAAVLRRGLSTAPDQRYASMAELVSVLTAGRHGMASQRIPAPTWGGARDRLLGTLACTFDEQVASSPAAALIRVRRIADQARWLVIAPHDPSAPQLRAAFARYFERLHAADAPRTLRPIRLIDERSEATGGGGHAGYAGGAGGSAHRGNDERSGAMGAAAGSAPRGNDERSEAAGAAVGKAARGDGEGLALLFEDLACVPLSGLIRQAAGRDPVPALRIACALTRAVHALAQLGYALDPAALDGLPIGVERYDIGPIDPTCLVDAGTDQPGRYRIVGAALLAAMTGVLPELGAMHGAPMAEAERQLPAALRALIERLLDPAGYRSARGVLHDLELCLAELRRGRALAAFALGTRDVGGQFQVSNVLRGRQRELAEFEAVARELRGGSSGLVLVSGPSGIGKTVLIQEMAARHGRGWRIRGKFDQYANNEPYATFTQALRGLIRQILDEPPAAREAWRDHIVQAVAPNAQLLFSVIPELRGLIGEQPAVAAIPPVESATRFGVTLKRLLAACAAHAELLVVALDDMQWCDPASIRLIDALLAGREVGHMLWICAFRDPDHPLHAQLAAVPVPRARKAVFSLGPLSHDELQAFLADTLGCTADRAAALATFFRDKTDGNPLFARTLLTSLHDQGLFTFSPHHESWGWDDAAIRSAELPGDIQELIVRKIEALSPAARRLLSVASCVGRDVEAALLVEAVSRWNHPRDELAAAIRECVSRGLLAATPARTPGDAGEAELLNFTHDRVQQTAYRFLDPALRETVLLEAGRALLERSSPAEVAEKLFRIVGYLNGGAAQADAALRDRIIELNLVAAQRALVANAFVDSARFLRSALALLPDDRWTSRYDQTVELHIKYMHALSLLGDREQEDQLFALLRDHVRTSVHLGQIYELKVMLESSRGEHRAAIERGIAGLRALGERISPAPGRLAAAAELARTWRGLRRIDPDDLQARPSSRSEDAAASRLLVALSAPAYLTDANLLAIVMMRIVRRSLAFGMSDVSSHGFAGFGLIISGLLGAYERARRYAMVAHKLDERFGNPWLAPKVDLMSGIFIQPWTRPFERCEDVLARGATVASDNADFVYASYTSTSLACLMYYRGAPLTAVASAASAALRHTHRARDHDMETVVTTVIHAVRCLRGETETPIDLSTTLATAGHDDRAFMATLDERTTPIGVFFCPAIRCGVLYLHGRADLACELGQRAGAFEANALSNPSLAEYLFYYAMALLERWPHLRGPERRAARRLVRRALARFAVWSRHCPENFTARHALLDAELARVDDRGQILDRLNAALEAAVRHDRVQYEALAAELAARYCDAHGQTTMAELYLERSLRAYQRWGATTKVRLLTDRLAPRGT